MQDNPYSEIVRAIRKDAGERLPQFYRFGKVVSANPLRIDVAGTIQEKSDLSKSSGLPVLMAGDRCLLVPMDDEQRYLILCKVVDV